jgi:ubiquinone/menaquinone biosynthesis C-methylase UbiE
MIQSYNIRWVADPLHQWSRQWEYPYIISRLEGIKKSAKIIDLGAGVSFLPYYLKEKQGLKNILAVDYDPSLENLYHKVNSKVKESIDFQNGDMRNLHAIEDSSADIVYSVSVLEHTDSYPTVLKEVYRILKPGGSLVLTFDISLDGLDDIPLERAKHLVASMEKIFGTKLAIDLDSAIKQPNLVTSDLMAKRDKTLMPWQYPALNVVKHLIKDRKPGSMYKKLTFCCLTVTKKS